MFCKAIVEQIPKIIIMTIVSKVPDAIIELAIPLFLPYPLSCRLIHPGTMIEGLMQDIA